MDASCVLLTVTDPPLATQPACLLLPIFVLLMTAFVVVWAESSGQRTPDDVSHTPYLLREPEERLLHEGETRESF